MIMSHPVSDASLVSEGSPSSLADLSQKTLESYRQLLLLYSRDTTSDQYVTMDKVLAEYGRLNIWIEQTGAALHGRGSLEDVLQTDRALIQDVIGVFRQLSRQVLAGNSHIILTRALALSASWFTT